MDLQSTFCPKTQKVSVTGIPALPHYYIYVMPTKKKIFSTVVQKKNICDQKIPSQLKYHKPAIFVHRKVWSAMKSTHSTSFLALRSEEIHTAGRPESSVGAKDKFCLVLTQKVYRTKCRSKCPVLVQFSCDYLHICALKDAGLHLFSLCMIFFSCDFIWQDWRDVKTSLVYLVQPL